MTIYQASLAVDAAMLFAARALRRGDKPGYDRERARIDRLRGLLLTDRLDERQGPPRERNAPGEAG